MATRQAALRSARRIVFPNGSSAVPFHPRPRISDRTHGEQSATTKDDLEALVSWTTQRQKEHRAERGKGGEGKEEVGRAGRRAPLRKSNGALRNEYNTHCGGGKKCRRGMGVGRGREGRTRRAQEGKGREDKKG